MQYKHFGIMIDCSGNGVLKVEKVKDLIDKMEKMGYNLLELCTDDTYKIEDEPYFGYLRGGYTKAEIQEMDEYAKAHGVELVPCIQTLAHLTNLVKLPHYADIVDIGNILMVDNPKTYQLIDKMFAALADMYTTRLVNIGMDEAHMLGLGKFLDRHGYQNRFDIFLRHLNKVVEIAKKHGFKPHIWSDMFFRLATGGAYYKEGVSIPDEVKQAVPKDVELCYWDYGEHELKEEIFKDMFDAHQQFDREVWFAGGAWTWNGFAPHNKFSLDVMKMALKQATEHNVENIMITIWAGDRNECSYFSVLPSLYAMKEYALGNFDEKSIAKGFEETFGLSYQSMMTLDIPNKTKLNPEVGRVSSACKTLLFNDCFLGWKDSAIETEWPIPYGEYAKKLAQAKASCEEYGYIFDTLIKLCEVLEIKGDLGLRTRKAYQAGDRATLRSLADCYAETELRVKAFYQAYKIQWKKECKPYGWEVHEIRLGDLRSRLLDCKERIEEYLEGKTDSIPELEETILPYADWKLQYNSYRGLVTVSEL